MMLSTNVFEREGLLTSALYMQDSPGALDLVDPTVATINQGKTF